MAVRRRPHRRNATIFHSDRGGQYNSQKFATHLENHRIRPSVGRTGVCRHNAWAELFNATLKNERAHARGAPPHGRRPSTMLPRGSKPILQSYATPLDARLPHAQRGRTRVEKPETRSLRPPKPRSEKHRALLQPPFFDPGVDDAVNYAAIGAVIGHEIGHGFDDQGSAFDGTGRVEDWWTEADREAFEARTKALIAQYDAYRPALLVAAARREGAPAEEAPHVNGALTIGENIGDLGGLGIALKAYGLALGRRGVGSFAHAPVIDGLSALERFFYSWARIWRGKDREDRARLLLTIDPHSPAEFRCNGIVRNVDAFYEAFGVGEGDALWLAPEERVTIW